MNIQVDEKNTPQRTPEETVDSIAKHFNFELTVCQRGILALIVFDFFVTVLFVFYWICVGIPEALGIGCTYAVFILFLFSVIAYYKLTYKKLVHDKRLEDPSEVDALFVEADTVEQRLLEPERPEKFKDKKEQLDKESKCRLKALEPGGWTEFELLSLNQMLIDFLKIEDLISRARLSLSDLEEYAKDSAISYNRELYYMWKEKIEADIEIVENFPQNTPADDIGENSEKSKIYNKKVELEKDCLAESLRADLRTLLEHVANYKADWSRGSVIIAILVTFIVIAIPVLIAMGLLPTLFFVDKLPLGWFNWGVLGIAGSFAAVVHNIRNSDEVEVGNTHGVKEVMRTLAGSALGFIAGLLMYGMLGGGILPFGSIVPNVTSGEGENIALSFVWAVASGFSFEKVFDRMKSVTEVNS